MNDIVKSIAMAYVKRHGRLVNYGAGHVVRELTWQGHLVEVSVGGVQETLWIDKQIVS